MFFFFKRSAIHVDVFVTNAQILETYPIIEARHHYPDWWKSMPKSYAEVNSHSSFKEDVSTIKLCSGFIDLYQKGFIIPLWSDLRFETLINSPVRFNSPDNFVNVNFHPAEQLPPELRKFVNVKILSPWAVSEKSGVKFHFGPAFWNNPDFLNKILTPPGIVDYKIQHGTHINLLVPNRNNMYFFPANTALAHITPITEKKVVLHRHLISQSEYDSRFTAYRPKYVGSMNERKKRIKSLTSESKCPFRF